jgi:hypothetical protein
MKIELMFNDQQITVGFKLIREDGDDVVTIERVRDMLFWGLGETALDYDGRKSDKETNQTLELMFTTKAHQKENKEQREKEYMEFLQKIKEEKENLQNQ